MNKEERKERVSESIEKVKETHKIIAKFFVETLNGMAHGLFATLIIGTIISTIGGFFPEGGVINTALIGASKVLQNCTGIGIAIGIGLALKFDTLKLVTIAITGELASYFSLTTKFVTNGVINNTFQTGDPLTIYIVAILVCLFFKYVYKKSTPVDIILIPLSGVLVGLIISLLIRYPTIYVTYGVQYIVSKSTLSEPFVMGVIISVIMGMALTAPISSAAIAAMIFTASSTTNLQGLKIASGAAIIGCCTQMVGFAIQSIRDNNIGKVISVGLGTSMLQFKNILKKPVVWLPTIIASAILGPIATTVLNIECMGSSAGMGTAGLVGQIGTLASMGNSTETWLIIILFEIVAPAILVFLIDLMFRNIGAIKKGDLEI